MTKQNIPTESHTEMNSSQNTDSSTPLLEVRDLEVTFDTQNGPVHAVRGVSFTLERGESLAIVGESGSGKSTSATAVINLLPSNGRITAGSVKLDGEQLVGISRKDMEKIRGSKIGYVPQDPMSNLNPVWNIGFQVKETLRANGMAKNAKEAEAKAIEALQNAGLPDAAKRLRQYPHQFSGGMRQRALIGIGLSSQPKLLIADEPTSALDVTVQRVILDHLETLTKELGTSVIFITHDLGLAAERAEKLVVMYRGQVVEAGPSREILANPLHPYTQRLVAAAPSLASRRIQAVKTHESIDLAAPTSAIDLQLIERAEHREEVAATATPIISLKDVTKQYKIRTGTFTTETLTAVDNVSFDVAPGTTTAIVGESGSGKSTVAKMVLKLEDVTSGLVRVDGGDVSQIKSSKDVLAFRRRVQPVFQDPYGTLDPLYNIAQTIAEPLVAHGIGNKSERTKRVKELLDQVSLPASTMGRYPNELSGGQRQRVAVARALALKPDVLVLDEAVSALDVLVQGQILNLLTDLQSDLGLSYLFITHDLAVVRLVADNVCVMKSGKIVEAARTDEVFDNPREKYTQDLLAAIPGASIELGS